MLKSSTKNSRLKSITATFLSLNDVFSAKVNELSAMTYSNHGFQRDLVNGNCTT